MEFLSSQRKPLPKALMLKDYLLDDMSSCSSNGFRSYPRRQCCTSVRFLMEIDLKNRDTSNRANRLLRSKPKASTTTKSALQRASKAMINAVRSLPFAAVRSPSASKPKKCIMPRSFSRKLLRRSFWKRTDKEIERWRSFRELLQEKEKSVEFSPSTTTAAAGTATTATATAAATYTNSSTTESNRNSHSWSDSEFTSEYLPCSSGNSVNSGENDVAESRSISPEKAVSNRVGVTTTTNSVENAKKQRPHEDEKEQFSPVSILDFPFDDEEEVPSPYFRSRLARMEGTKQKLMQKIRRFESLAQLEPVNLEKRIALSESDDNVSLKSPLQPCSVLVQCNIIADKEDEKSETEHKALDLLNLLKITSNSFKLKADTLLLDFFKETLTETDVGKDGHQSDHALINVANDWINGESNELLLEWEVQKNRESYIRDMEKEGRWRMWDEDHKEEVAMGLEDEVFASLIDELLIDLVTS